MSSSYKRIEAVRKAGEILKHLANQKEPVAGTDVARALNVPEGTVMCHMATLEDLGFVQAIGDKYRLGLGLGLIWARVKSNLEGERDRINRDIEAIQIEEGASNGK